MSSKTSNLVDTSVPSSLDATSASNASATAAPFHSITAIDLDGIHTDIVLHRFADKIVLLVTQFARISNVFVAHANTMHNGIVKTFRDIEHRFGTDTDEIQSAIGHLVTAVPALNDAPVDIVVTLSMRTIDRSAVKRLVEALSEIM